MSEGFEGELGLTKRAGGFDVSSRYTCRLERCLWGLIPQGKSSLF